MPSLLETITRKFTTIIESFGGLVEVARNAKGVVGFGIVWIVATVLLATSLFSDGSGDTLLKKIEDLDPNQTMILAVMTIGGLFAILLAFIVTGYLQERSRSHPEASTTPSTPAGENAPNATQGSPLVSGVAFGSVSFANARGEPFALAEPGKSLGIIPPPELPRSARRRVFLSYAQRDHLLACKLAAELRRAGFYVWHVEEGRPYSRLTLEVEQAIRSSEVVISLVTNTFFDSLILRGEVDFARDIGKIVIPVLVESPDDALMQRLATAGMLTLYRDWDAEIARVLDRVRRESAARSSVPDDTGPFPAVDLDVDAPPEADAGLISAAPPGGSARKHQPRPAAQALQPGTPPFIFGAAVTPDWMVGRRAELAAIRGRMALTLASMSIVAERRMGKTSLLMYVAERAEQVFPGHPAPVVVYLNMQDARTKNPVQVMRLLRRHIRRQIGRDLWPERADGDLAALADAFEALGDEGTRLILCLDEWENVMAFPEMDGLVEQLRASGQRSEIGMVVATAHDLGDLWRSGEVTSPFYNIFETIHLGLMPRAEWMELVSQAYERSGRQVLDQELDLIGRLAGGHPCLTQMAGSVVWQARLNGWSRSQVYTRYLQMSSSTLRSLWVRQSDYHRAAIREALGIYSAVRAPRAVWEDLKRRGVLTESGEVFCKPFADLVMAEEL